MSKFHDLFDSFTWNAAMSLVSLLVLADYLVSMIAASRWPITDARLELN